MSLLWGGRKVEVRDTYQDVFARGGSVDSLNASSIEKALMLAPVYSSIRLLADQFAAAPLRAYRTAPDGSKARLDRQPSLIVSPSSTVSAFTWKYQALTSVLLRGNAYGYVTSWDAAGWPASSEWLNPDRVEVDESGTLPEFYYLGRHIDRSSVIHVPGFAVAGSCVGVSPLAAFKTVIETGLRAQDFGRDWFKNGAVPGGILKNTAQTISPETVQTARERFKVATQGRELFVTGADWDYSTLSVPADEARFIETLKMSATQIANVYGVPPERVGGETGSSMTYGNREQDSLDLVTFGLRPWFVRFEEALSALMPRPQYVRFNIDAMVRADLLTRMQAHEIALRIGLETNDEGRAIEDRPPLTDAERQSWTDNYRAASVQPVQQARSMETRDGEQQREAHAVVEFRQGEQPAPIVNVTVEPTPVTVNVEPTPVTVNVDSPSVTVDVPAPQVDVTVQPAEVTVVDSGGPRETVTVFDRDQDGFVTGSRSVERDV